MATLDLHALAAATGTSVSTVERLIDCGALPRGEDGFAPSDIARVRLILALEAAGVSAEALGRMTRSGSVTLDFIDPLMPSPIPLLRESLKDVLSDLGIPPSLSRRVRAVLGSAGADGEPVREDDAELWRMVADALALGATESDIARILLVFADGLRSLVEAQRDFIDDLLIVPFVESGGAPAEVLGATVATRLRYREIGRRLLVLLHERLVEETIFQSMVELTEAALAAQGALPQASGSTPAIAFVDVSGYTRLAEESGDLAAADAAGRLAEWGQTAAGPYGGRLVKVLGDGIMLHFRDSTSAVSSTLALVEGAGEHQLPPLHAGLHAGPVVRRDGDYFGTVVNVSARMAGRAGPGEVLVTNEIVQCWEGGAEVTFEPMGLTSFRNVGDPVAVFRARPGPLPG